VAYNKPFAVDAQPMIIITSVSNTSSLSKFCGTCANEVNVAHIAKNKSLTFFIILGL